MMRRLIVAFLAGLTLVPISLPSVGWADSGPSSLAGISATQVSTPGFQPCPVTSNQAMNMAETSQADCCKGHKGICGCRAGKIICCDSTASPNCTCHGEEGFIE